MRVLSGAGGHAPPPLEPAAAACRGVARLIPFRGVRLGVRAPAPGRHDDLEAPLREPGAEGVAAIGPVDAQAGPRRVRPGFRPGLGTVAALAARHAQAQGTAASICQPVDRGAEAAPAAAEGGLGPFVLGCARRADARARPGCPATQRTDLDRPAGRPSGASRRLERTRGPSGDRPSSPCRTRPATGAKGRPFAPSAGLPRKAGHAFPFPRAYRNKNSGKNECGAIGYRSSGAILAEIGSVNRLNGG